MLVKIMPKKRSRSASLDDEIQKVEDINTKKIQRNEKNSNQVNPNLLKSLINYEDSDWYIYNILF